MTEPLIDILMATYNGERFVGEQIESIQMQTYKNWRLLVSDDCSSDRTLDVVRRYAAVDNRISVVSEGMHYGGAKENFFALMRKTDARYAMFCDQDDFWLPDKVEKTFNAMHDLEEEYGEDEPLLIFTDMKVVDESLNVVDESFENFTHFDPKRREFRQLLAQNVAAGCSMLINRALLALSLSSDDVKAEMHDWWVMLLASAFGHIYFIDESLNLYRQHGDNEVGANKYSVVGRAKQTKQTIRNFVVASDQARAFESVYGGRLDQSQLRSLRRYVKASQAATPLHRVFCLISSGCWKRGARKVGQVVAAVKITNFKEKRGC